MTSVTVSDSTAVTISDIINSSDDSYYNYTDDVDYAYADYLFHLTDSIEIYSKPILYIICILGNVLCLVVLDSSHYKNVALRPQLIAIACLDIIVILLSLRDYLARLIVSKGSPVLVVLAPFNDITCGLALFLYFFFTHFSAWTIALLTVERAFVTRFPLKAKPLCTVRNIMIVWLAIGLVLAAVNSSLFFTATYSVEYEITSCRFKTGNEEFSSFTSAWDWVDLFFISLGPFGIIVCCNVLILSSIISHTKLKKSLSNNTYNARDESEKVHTLTAMLMAISVVFLLTTMPSSIFNSTYYYWFPDAETNLVSMAESSLVFAILDDIYLLNHVTNFIFYMVFGSKFRKAFKHLFALDKGLCKMQGTVVVSNTRRQSEVSRKTSSTLITVSQGKI